MRTFRRDGVRHGRQGVIDTEWYSPSREREGRVHRAGDRWPRASRAAPRPPPLTTSTLPREVPWGPHHPPALLPPRPRGRKGAERRAEVASPPVRGQLEHASSGSTEDRSRAQGPQARPPRAKCTPPSYLP